MFARVPRGSLIAVSRHAAGILQHPREMHQVPSHEGGISLREIVVQPYAAVAIGRTGARLPDPTGIGLWRDDVAEVLL